MTDIDSKRARPIASNLWVLRAQILLQRSLDDVDASTRSKLNRARQHALAALDPPPPRRLAHWLGAGMASAGLALVIWHGMWREKPEAAVVATPSPPVISIPDQAQLTAVTAPDFDLLADEEQFEILQDLEFYAWLEANGADEG